GAPGGGTKACAAEGRRRRLTRGRRSTVETARTGIIAPMESADPTTRVGNDSNLFSTVEAVRSRTTLRPRIGLVLGSGLGAFAEEVDGVTIPYSELPGMPVSSAPGHAGRLHVGYLDGHEVVAMQGRVHPYEGFSAKQASYPVAVMAALGVKSLVVTNACGGMDPKFKAGELMLQLDFINVTGQNPLIGPLSDPSLERFPVM